MLQHKCKDVGVNMEDKELVKMFNLTLKRRETILFFLIVVINGLTWIVLDIGLDTCVVRKGKVKGGGKNREVLRKEGCSFWWSFGLVTKFSQPKA